LDTKAQEEINRTEKMMATNKYHPKVNGWTKRLYPTTREFWIESKPHKSKLEGVSERIKTLVYKRGLI